MSVSDKEIARKTINWCKSIKKNIGKFSYESDDEDNYDDDTCVQYYEWESNFDEIITKQHERLNDVYVELNDFLEDYDGEHEYEFSQAKMNIDCADVQLQDILSKISSWDNTRDFNDQIVEAIKYLDEAIEYLEGCSLDIF
jgi:hypothetical protein